MTINGCFSHHNVLFFFNKQSVTERWDQSLPRANLNKNVYGYSQKFLYVFRNKRPTHANTRVFLFWFYYFVFRGSIKQINLLNSQQWKLLGLSRIDILQLSIRKLKNKGSIFPQTNCWLKFIHYTRLLKNLFPASEEFFSLPLKYEPYDIFSSYNYIYLNLFYYL